MKKIILFYKCFGFVETLKKIIRYGLYLTRFNKKDNYYELSVKEKKNVVLKSKDFYVIISYEDIKSISDLIHAINSLGFNVVIVTNKVKNNVKFLNISKIIDINSFVYNEDYLIISFDKNYSYNYTELDEIDTLDKSYERLDLILNNSSCTDLVSIIVLNYNNGLIIDNCLDKIINNSKRYNIEVIVVDNQSTDGSYEKLKSRNDIKLYRNCKNGCSSGRNLGLKMAKGKYVLFLDSDQYVLSKYWLDNYFDIIKLNNDRVVVGWAAGWFNRKYLSNKTVDFYEYRYMPPQGNYRSDIAYLGTGGIMFKRDILQNVSFDLEYDPTCYEDTDFSLQLKDKGIRLCYSPNLAIYHDEHQTTNSGSKRHEKLMNKNGEYFLNKWKKKNIKLLKEGVK